MNKPSLKQYIAIDLKSFYASVECVERGLDPLDTNLVVADESRTRKTICLAISPSLKTLGLGGRARLFEVDQKVADANFKRKFESPCRRLNRKSVSYRELQQDSSLAIDFLIAPPRMGFYIDYSTRIYNIYLKYIAPEDIHVYSIDEVIIDATTYLTVYNITARDLARKMIREVLNSTGITATAGIGTNMYLCKVAMDIMAKKMPPDKDGVRIAELDEMSYRRELWTHKPLTDFWRIGRGIAGRLSPYGIHTMGDIARLSITNEHLLYNMFGVNAELIIDHAWGWEPVTMEMVKNYRPNSHSTGSGQVLTSPYSTDKARNVIIEMAESVALELVERKLVARKIEIVIGYDQSSLDSDEIAELYNGKVVRNHFGRMVPASGHATANLQEPTSSSSIISKAVSMAYDKAANPLLLVRRLYVTACGLIPESEVGSSPRQLHLFSDYLSESEHIIPESSRQNRERRLQETMLKIKRMYGKNAILKGLNFADGATQRIRNTQIGGHHA
ncbi:MAG: DNA methylase [Bacteroides sp.]|nr:DNA methylase [Bacteroides sp.]